MLRCATCNRQQSVTARQTNLLVSAFVPALLVLSYSRTHACRVYVEIEKTMYFQVLRVIRANSRQWIPVYTASVQNETTGRNNPHSSSNLPGDKMQRSHGYHSGKRKKIERRVFPSLQLCNPGGSALLSRRGVDWCTNRRDGNTYTHSRLTRVLGRRLWRNVMVVIPTTPLKNGHAWILYTSGSHKPNSLNQFFGLAN